MVSAMSQRTLLAPDQPQSLVLADAVQNSDSGIVSRTIIQTQELHIVLFAFADGQELTTHTNRRRAMVHILAGSCEVYFADKWHSFAAGTLLHLPPNFPHAVRATSGSFSMLLTLGAETTNRSETPSP